jgi:hypothetical protein
MESINFKSGAFAVYEPEEPATMSRFIPFRFNPETLSRQVAIEQGQGGGGQSGAGGANSGSSDEAQGADANSGTLKERFTVLLRFDLEERYQPNSALKAEFGIAPEVAALEELMYPVESPSEQPSDGSEPVSARAKRPTVLFIWGEKRVVPVRITGMTINETLFNHLLYPIRAEIEVSLQVLSEADARGNTRVSSALNFTAAKRKELAKLYLDNTAQQGTNVDLP